MYRKKIPACPFHALSLIVFFIFSCKCPISKKMLNGWSTLVLYCLFIKVFKEFNLQINIFDWLPSPIFILNDQIFLQRHFALSKRDWYIFYFHFYSESTWFNGPIIGDNKASRLNFLHEGRLYSQRWWAAGGARTLPFRGIRESDSCGNAQYDPLGKVGNSQVVEKQNGDDTSWPAHFILDVLWATRAKLASRWVCHCLRVLEFHPNDYNIFLCLTSLMSQTWYSSQWLGTRHFA